MAFKRLKNAILLAKIEATEGVDAAPTGVDALRCANVKITYNSSNTTTGEYTGSLDESPPIIGGTQCQITFDVYLKGNSSPGVTAPEWGKLLKACGWSETLTGTALGAPTAITAGTVSSATLGTLFVGADQAYRGMPILFTGTTPIGQSTILDWKLSTKMALLTDTAPSALAITALAQIPPNTLYTPGSVSIPSMTQYFFGDGLKFAFIGARGSAKFSVKSGAPLMISFTFNGMYGGESDTANPTPTLDALIGNPVWKNAGGLVGGPGAFTLNSLPIAGSDFSLDNGNKLVNPDDPNSSESFDAGQIISRDMTGTFTPYQTLIATNDIMSDFRAMTARPVHLRMGATVGNRLSLTIPSARYTKADPGDNGGLMNRSVTFDVLGNDASTTQLCVY